VFRPGQRAPGRFCKGAGITLGVLRALTRLESLVSFTTLYKPVEGKYTRICTAIGIGLVVLYTAYWLVEELKGISGISEYVLAAVALGLIAAAGVFTWWLLNKPNIVEFMINTESEMRKVNWPSKKEITGSTWVVICGTLLLTVMIFTADLLFTLLFTAINIIDKGSN
jgi:preprotein translocase SecE subunit